MKKKFVPVLLCFALLFCLLPTPARADIGPKPSVSVALRGLSGERCYATLLSETPSTGPHSAIGTHPGNERLAEGDPSYAVFLKFAAYEDADGYSFLQFFDDCTETQTFTWGYYPPARFKLLLYFPDQDCFAVSSAVYERYAFDSYFTTSLAGISLAPGTVQEGLTLQKSYDYRWESISLVARIAATVAVELVIALLFGLRAKKQLLFLTWANLATQVLLNVLLNVINYNQGSFAFVFHYVWMELLVAAIEAVLYVRFLPQKGEPMRAKWMLVLYALVANAASFCAGLWLAYIIPGIF